MPYTLGNIHAFDFDGTLTRRDSLLEIIRFARGTKGFALCMLRFMPLLVMMKLGLYPNRKVKQAVFAYCFGGMTEDAFNKLCRRFADAKKGILRPKGVETVRKLLAEGNRVVIVSASINNWVEPFAAMMGDIAVVGTMVETRDGRLTGRLLTKNCYGEEKVRRLLNLYPDRKQYRLTAYGDSRGDRELLDFADEGHYKPFR